MQLVRDSSNDRCPDADLTGHGCFLDLKSRANSLNGQFRVDNTLNGHSILARLGVLPRHKMAGLRVFVRKAIASLVVT